VKRNDVKKEKNFETIETLTHDEASRKMVAVHGLKLEIGK